MTGRPGARASATSGRRISAVSARSSMPGAASQPVLPHHHEAGFGGRQQRVAAAVGDPRRFMRDRDRMRGWADEIAGRGMAAVTMDFCQPTAFDGRHAENATAAAFRHHDVQIVKTNGMSNGAIAVPLLAQHQAIMRLVRAESISVLEWSVLAGTGLAIAGIAAAIAARIYHRESLAVSA